MSKLNDDVESGLDLQLGDQVVEWLLIAKVSNFEEGGTAVSIAASEGLDWVAQYGLLRAATVIVERADI